MKNNWLAWGGDEGIEWAQRKLKEISNQKFAAKKISLDFDDTLSIKKGQELALRLIDEGNEVYIITRRQEHDNKAVFKVADELEIPHSRIYFTGGHLKWETIKKLGIDIHYDNNLNEIVHINDNTEAKGILFQ